MINKLTHQATGAGKLKVFPDFPPRDDMQNFFYLYKEGHPAMLIRHFGNRDTTVVMSEVPIDRSPTNEPPRIPDLLIAFNVNQATAIVQNGYAVEEQGKPPDFVLEVASVTTARNDYTGKRADYAAFGIPEYWRFDPTGGGRYEVALAGDRLIDGAYQPIEIIRADANRLWGHSEVLNLDLCWEEGRLRWWDPSAGRYLETHDEEAEGRIAEREERIVERNGRIAEREARLAAEARIRELEAELRRRQES